MTCIAPSLVLVETAASDFGRVAEAVIAVFYLRHVRRPAFFPVPPAADFMDISDGFGNTALYVSYLGLHHPGLGVAKVLQLSSDRLTKIPDLVTFAPPAGSEFYEVKPNSASGRVAGHDKVTFVHALYHSFGLPYVPGTSWKANERLRLFEGKLLGIEVKVQFHFFVSAPGLVLYEVCVEGRTRALTNAEVAAIAALVLLALLAIVATDGAAAIPVLLAL